MPIDDLPMFTLLFFHRIERFRNRGIANFKIPKSPNSSIRDRKHPQFRDKIKKCQQNIISFWIMRFWNKFRMTFFNDFILLQAPEVSCWIYFSISFSGWLFITEKKMLTPWSTLLIFLTFYYSVCQGLFEIPKKRISDYTDYKEWLHGFFFNSLSIQYCGSSV